jgi:hypothetical protein
VLRPADRYVTAGASVNFATVIESAGRRDETAIGYRLHRLHDQPPGYGVVINPAKTEPITFGAGDQIIIVGHHRSPGSASRRHGSASAMSAIG